MIQRRLRGPEYGMARAGSDGQDGPAEHGRQPSADQWTPHNFAEWVPSTGWGDRATGLAIEARLWSHSQKIKIRIFENDAAYCNRASTMARRVPLAGGTITSFMFRVIVIVRGAGAYFNARA